MPDLKFLPQRWLNERVSWRRKPKQRNAPFRRVRGGLESTRATVNIYRRLRHILRSLPIVKPITGIVLLRAVPPWGNWESPGEPTPMRCTLLPRREMGLHILAAVSPSSPHNGAGDDGAVWESTGYLPLALGWAGGCTQLLTGVGGSGPTESQSAHPPKARV